MSTDDSIDMGTNLLRFNKKRAIHMIYEADEPGLAARAKRKGGKVQEWIKAPTPEQCGKFDPETGVWAAGSWNKKEMKKEVKKRGFMKPPYHFIMEAEHKVRVSIGKDYFNVLAYQQGTETEGSKAVKAALCKQYPCLKDGADAPRKCEEEDLSAILLMASNDPRFRNGQPIVTPGFVERKCTDIACCGLFWLFWMLMAVIMVIGWQYGDPLRLVRPVDFEGGVCGGDAAGQGKLGEKKNLFYPSIPEDALKLMQSSSLSCLQTPQGCFTGLCIEKCPKPGDIVCDYSTDEELATEKTDTARETKRRYYADRSSLLGKKKCWFVAMTQINVMMRCIPYEKKVEAVKYTCVEFYQNASMTSPISMRTALDTKDKNKGQIEVILATCEGTVEIQSQSVQRMQGGSDKLSGSLTGVIAFVTQILSDVSASWWLIVGLGPIASAVISFGFIMSMMIFAPIIVWLTVLGCAVFGIAISGFLTWKAGFLDGYITKISDTVHTHTGVNLTAANAAASAQLSSISTDASASATSFAAEYGVDGTGQGLNPGDIPTANDIYKYAAFVSYAFTVLAILAPCLFRKQIRLCIALIQEAAASIRKMKGLLFYPFFTYFWIFVMFLYFIGGSLWIISADVTWDGLNSLAVSVADAAKDTTNGTALTFSSIGDTLKASASAAAAAKNISDSGAVQKVDFNDWQGNSLIRSMMAVHTFGYIWTSEFVKAIGQLTIAGAIALDYWVNMDDVHNRPQWATASSFWRAIRYHSGTAVFGALIIAIIRTIRYIMMYVDQKTSELQKSQKIVKILMCLVHCCLWCLEKCARFITMSAYILTAIEGGGFCISAWRSFKLLFSNSARIATTTILCTIILILAQVAITLFCVIGAGWSITNLPVFQPDGTNWVDSPVAPCILVAISAIFVANCFMGVYQMAIMTLLLSFCLDEDKFKKGKYKDKLNPQGEVDKQMFCIVNKKFNLIKQVSDGAQAEMIALKNLKDTEDSKWGGNKQIGVMDAAKDAAKDEAFRAADKDRDGYLDSSESTALVGAASAQVHLDTWDEDKDGKLDKEEFKASTEVELTAVLTPKVSPQEFDL